jgi:hypothetical protein
MEFNKILFPAPLSSYTALDPDLIWIPKKEKSSLFKRIFKKKKADTYIPAFFLPYLNFNKDQGSN